MSLHVPLQFNDTWKFLPETSTLDSFCQEARNPKVFQGCMAISSQHMASFKGCFLKVDWHVCLYRCVACVPELY